MPNAINPMLAKRDAQIKAAYMEQLSQSQEIDRIAVMLMLNRDFKVGPGRAKKLLNNFETDKLEIVEAIISDSKDDKEILYTKRNLAARMKEIFGGSWAEVKEMFPLLKEYWG